MLGANAVDASEPLNQAHRIPMKVMVDYLVAILKVEAFGKNISGDYRIQLDIIGTPPRPA